MPLTTQSLIPISEIKDGVIIQENGSLSSILLISSFNFALKSEDEQQVIFLHFGGFLNSLEVSIQIFVQSRRFNVNPYIDYVSTFLEKQENELLQTQTKEYINFIKSFVKTTDVISKNFFLIVSYIPLTTKKETASLLKFLNRTPPGEKTKTFPENRTQLAQRTSFIQQGLQSMGLRATPLSSEELVELLYKSFNPGDTQSPSAVL